jgi:ParB/RepB/Spo0J family partition protein
MHLENIPTDKITIGTQRIRTIVEDDAFAELCLDMAARGLLQPIGVTPLPDGTYQLLWGLRRLTAARRLHWPTIPAHIVTGDPASIRATALRENIHRSQMTLEDECTAVMQLAHEEGHSIQDIATLLNRSTDWVRRRLTIANLPTDLRVATYTGEIATAAAEAIAIIQDPETRAWIINTAREYKWTVDDVRTAVKLTLSGTNITEAIDAAQQAAQQPTTKDPRPEPLIPCTTCDTPTPISQTKLIHTCPTCYATLTNAHNPPRSDDRDSTNPTHLTQKP